MKKIRHFITLADVSVDELNRIFELAEEIKAEFQRGIRSTRLDKKVLALIFEKMSLRTRVSFETGMAHLGGSSMLLEDQHIGLGTRESFPDVGHVLSSMVDAIVFRAKKHESVVKLAQYSSCPVINALTDKAHPCQALADMLTIKEEFGSLQGKTVAWIGDSNNVAASLIEAATMLGVHVIVSSPSGYQFSKDELDHLLNRDVVNGFEYELIEDPVQAVKRADAVYTDVWVSMGQESEETERKQAFANYQVNQKLMNEAKKDAIFLHCLPARRGLEVTDEVMDSPQSRIVQQASNRMHAQKGLLVWLLGQC